MDFLPEAPDATELCKIEPSIQVLAAGSSLARIWFAASTYLSGFKQFRSFGPTASRFDHHLPAPDGSPEDGERSILYAVHADGDPDAFVTAIAEVFQKTRVIDLATEEPHLSIFEITQDIPLLDLSGHFTTRIGASAALSSGPRSVARAWSRSFYDAWPEIQGLRYRSSMSGGSSIAVALYERSSSAMPTSTTVDLPLSHPSLRRDLVNAAEMLGFQITPSLLPT